ncbi:MAG TPA: squalene synthase HpnC [Solirubrobacteraceae bacterium]
MALELSPPEIPSAHAVMGRARGENFPVAARVLSREHRRGLMAVYGFARMADELGDELEGDRLAALDWLEGELDRAYAGRARHPLLGVLGEALTEHPLPREPFARLIEANRVDQRVTRYRTWEQLEDYCKLSANPVGELVLGVFDLATPERIALSDRVCTALQLVEHLQDVADDLARGRIYLPQEDLARFGCSHERLLRAGADREPGLGALAPGARRRRREEDLPPAGLRETVVFEAERARELLAAGVALVAGVSGRAKLAVAAFVAGGDAAVEEIERARGEILAGVSRAGAWRRARALARVLARGAGASAAIGWTSR